MSEPFIDFLSTGSHRVNYYMIIYAIHFNICFLYGCLPSSFDRGQRVQSARPSVQSSELGPPTPSTARECCSPPLDPRGETHSLPDEGVGEPIPTMGHTLWYSKYTITIIPRRPRVWNIRSPDPRPSHRSFADLSVEKLKEKTAKNHSVGEYPAISMICRENPAQCPSLTKNPPKYTRAYLVQ